MRRKFFGIIALHVTKRMNMVLSVEQLRKNYGQVRALQGISFGVPQGAIFGILGPNGSGKTTLLSIILDVLHADGGNYQWFGKEGSAEQRKMIGSLLETPNFYHYLSGIGNLRITRSISGRGSLTDLDKVLGRVGLLDRKASRFSTYSLGMKQRLAIAAALLGDPQVLVLDEPTNGLDPVGIAEIRELILALHRQGHTVIMASHLLDEVEKVCTHVVILNKGEIVATGLTEDVLSDDDLVEIGAADLEALEKALQGYPGMTGLRKEGRYLHAHFGKGQARTAEINSHCQSQGVVPDHLALKKQRLEARFFELTGN
jgi:ABC-2 type transport system ATP-binding protein